MAINSTSLLNPAPLTTMVDGVELYLTECESELEMAADSLGAESLRACTVMVSFAASDRERAALRPLLNALAFGQASSLVCNGHDWPAMLPLQLRSHLVSQRHDLVTAVIYTGPSIAASPEAIEVARDALRSCFGASLVALLVVTDQDSSRFESVQGISGFVIGAQGSSAETARSIFLCLTMLAAPSTLNGIDFEDLWPVFGTATAPSVLANAIWLRGGINRLEFASPSDADAVRQATRLVAVPLICGRWGMSELRHLMTAVRTCSAAEFENCNFFASLDAMATASIPSAFASVPILCYS